jgi:ABC-2 type transport system ATP-binding protein
MHGENRMDIDVRRERELLKEGIPRNTPVVVTNLAKRFGKFVALRDVSLHIPASTVFALLGPNGAAKTTFINLLTGLTEADEGEIYLLGKDMKNKKQR